MKQLKHFSIRTKLLIILVLTTITVLLAYARVSFSSFTKDKIAYVFDSTLSHTRATSSLIKSEVEKQIEKLQLILRGYNVAQSAFTPYANSVFDSAGDIESIQIFLVDAKTSKPKLLSSLYKNEKPLVTFKLEKISRLIDKALSQGISLVDVEDQVAIWALALRTLDPVSKQIIVTVAFFNTGSFLDIISKSDSQNVYLVDKNKQYAISPKQPPQKIDEVQLQQQFEKIDMTGQSFGVKEISLKDNTSLLMSFAQVGVGGLWLAEVVPRAKALEALSELLYTTGKILLLLIGLTMFASVIFSSGLTTNLKRLHVAVQEVSGGNLDAKVDIKSRDEIGDLATGFNLMTDEIRRLIEQTKEATRMEGELKTARVVQSTLFPVPEARFQRAQIQGHNEPASECSGDWWNYHVIGSKIYVAIADATGHGVPAALVTAAARSAFTLISQFDDDSVAKKLKILNRAIYETMRGQIQMTFFLGCLDQETGIFTYSNASHDAPYVFPFESSEHQLDKQDIQNLSEANGSRLGESPNSVYGEATIELKAGQIMVFMTDGLLDVVSPEGQTFGERRLLKTLLSSFNEFRDPAKTNTELQTTISDFRKGTPLDDDVTFFFLAYYG